MVVQFVLFNIDQFSSVTWDLNTRKPAAAKPAKR